MGNIDPKLSEPLVNPLSKCFSDCSKYCLDECSCEFSCGCCKWSITTHHTNSADEVRAQDAHAEECAHNPGDEDFESINESD